MLELLGAATMEISPPLDVNQAAALLRARTWHEKNPWELKKAKTQRARLAAVRPLCQRYVEVALSQVVDHLFRTKTIYSDHEGMLRARHEQSQGGKRSHGVDDERTSCRGENLAPQRSDSREDPLTKRFKTLCV